MTINLNTKFNLGDQVYVAETYEDYWANSEPSIVTDVFIKINNSTTTVLYRLKQGEFFDVVSEYFIFATYDECKQWCEEHNK